MNKIGLGLCFAFTLALAPSANAAVELVSNGGFESGLTDWTQAGNTGFTGVDGSLVHSGASAFFTGPIGSDGFLSQAIATVAGTVYDISFWVANDGGATADFGVAFDGNSLYNETDVAGYGYTLFTFASVMATSASTLLSFNFRQDPAYYRLDDVSVMESKVQPPAVPLPAALPLLVTGFGGLGFIARRKKKAV